MLPAIIEKFTKINTIEEGLELLCQFGNPRLSRIGKQDKADWYCNIDMFVTGKGVEFKVASDFDCKTPVAAVNQCCERLKETLKSLDK